MSNDSVQLQNMFNPPLQNTTQSQIYDTGFQEYQSFTKPGFAEEGLKAS